MNKYPRLISLLLFLCINLSKLTAQCTHTGIITIGPSGTYTSLTAVANALRLDGLAGPLVLELQSNYSAAGETFPINFTGINCLSATNTLTIRPAAGASGLVISTASQYTFDLNATARVIIDGRPGGTGTTTALTIENTHSTGAAIRFINNASNDTLRYLNLRGACLNELPASSNTNDTVGVVKFAVSTTGNGCDYNLIDNCSIYDASTNTPGTLIYSDAAIGKSNDSNTVSNCKLFNFYQQNCNSYGIYLKQYNSQWTISNNSFYQTAARVYTLSTFTPDVFCIKILSPVYAGFQVYGNSIGGTQPLAGGSAMTMSGNFVLTTLGVCAAYYPNRPSSVYNNVITNISTSHTNTLAWDDAISLGISSGLFYGTCHDNIIGSTTGTGAWQFNSTGSSSSFMGITGPVFLHPDPPVIKNNKIGGITVSGSSTFYGINIAGGYYNIVDSNTIGMPGVPNSISSSGSGQVYGIRMVNYSSNNGTLYVTNNTISNLTSTSAFSSAGVVGIFSEGSSSGRYVVTNNVINNLKASSSSVSNLTPAASGIALNISGTPALLVQHNKIDRIGSTLSVAAGYVYGILYNGTATNGGDTLSANIVSCLSASSSGNVNLKGIHIETGNSVVYNNVVRLGIDENGNAIGGNYTMTGISENGGSNSILHNSVYIGGNNSTAASASTYAFNSGVTSGTRSVANNIFYNGRSGSTGTGKNYAVFVAGTTVPLSGLYQNYNLYFSDGTNGVLGRFNGADYTTLSAWSGATLLDNNSQYSNPNFLNMTGPLATMDYHLNFSTPAESGGTAAYTISSDIDDEVRSVLTPVDMGADAGLYSNVVIDNTPPAINFTTLPDAVTLNNRILIATISDAGSGVDTAGANKPRIWYRRKWPLVSAWVSNAGSLSAGTLNNGTYNFVIDYSLLPGSTAFADSIEYYVVAEDKATPVPNVGSKAAAQHTSVNVQVAAPLSPDKYFIRPQLAGDVLVGTGQEFTSLTNNGGLFQAINAWGLAGNINAKITSDLNETGAVHLLNSGLHNYDVNIVPATGSVKRITNLSPVTEPLIYLDQTLAHISFDGRFNNAGQFLQFSYAVTTPVNSNFFRSAFFLQMGTSNVTIRNCIIETNGWTCIESAGGTSLNNRFIDNNIHDLTSHPLATGAPGMGIDINSAGNSIISGNNISNAAISLLNVITLMDTTFITGNHFFSTLPFTSETLISLYGSHTTVIRDNYIGGSAPYCGGSPLQVAKLFRALRIVQNQTLSEDMNVSIQHNYIRNFKMPVITSSPNDPAIFNGIYFHHLAHMDIGGESGNFIGDTALADNIRMDVDVHQTECYGITFLGTKNVVIANNKIGGFTLNGLASNSSQVAGIGCPGYSTVMWADESNVSIYNNTIANLTSSIEGTGGYNLLHGIVYGDVEAKGPVNIYDNTIQKIHIKSLTGTAILNGLTVGEGQWPDRMLVQRNRISGLQNEKINGKINGIAVTTLAGISKLYNNMVSVTNSPYTNPVQLNGIYIDTYGGALSITSHTVDYNSVYIGGNATQADTSSVLRVESPGVPLSFHGSMMAFKNNLLYNNRTSVGTGRHTAIVVNTNNNSFNEWPSGVSDYNLMVVNDTSRVACWQSVTATGLTAFKAASGGDGNSYMALTSSVPAASFFINADTANLHLLVTDPHCWYVNGKGIAIDSISTDFDNNTRSTSINNGATDIGADEFTTGTQPPPLEIYGLHNPGGTETFMWAGRQVASVTWGPAGTLPTFGQVRWYTGVWPNDPTNGGTISGASYMNAYLQVPVTGGSGFKYNLTLNYSKALLGHVRAPSAMIINKKEINSNGSWKKVIPTVVDTTARTMVIRDRIAFSEFTGTDAGAPLSNITEETFTGQLYHLYLSPNPTRGLLNLLMKFNEPKHVAIVLYDVSGRRVYKTETELVQSILNKSIDISNCSRGTYTLVLQIEENFIAEKIILE
ncbi:MAG: T9SS type A sorting domain-containing protein [Ferruginibacter sp.]